VSTITRTEWKLFLREPVLVFWGLAFPAILLTVMGLASSGPDADLGGSSLVATYTPIVMLLALAVLGIQGMPGALATYRERGVLRRLATTPVGPARVLRAQVGVYAGVALGGTVLLLVVAAVAFGVHLPRQPLGFVLTLALTMAAVFALGLTLASLAPRARVASGLGALLFFPLMFFAGLWIPRPLMGDTLRDVSDFTPLGAAGQAIHQTMAGPWPAAQHLVVLAAYAVILTVVAVRVFRWE
jgi:ABC-2 type transport system permease protein